MKGLILMRHAKSDWSKAGSSDHDRTLNERGKMNATSLGIWLKERGLVPESVLCSTSTRTRQTLDLLAVEGAPDVRFEKELYLADANQILKILQSAKTETVLLVGHNPGIAAMAEQIVKTPPNPDGMHHYPTGATIVATFDVENWVDVTWGLGKVTNIVVPRDLPTPT